MPTRRITATELSRNLSANLNEVRYKDVSLDVWRGRELIARVVPPHRQAGFPIDRLNGLFAAMPKLGEADAADFLEDIRQQRRALSSADDPWAS